MTNRGTIPSWLASFGITMCVIVVVMIASVLVRMQVDAAVDPLAGRSGIQSERIAEMSIRVERLEAEIATLRELNSECAP